MPFLCKKYLAISIYFSGRFNDAAQLRRKSRMDDKQDPLGLQDGPFSFSMVRFNLFKFSIPSYCAVGQQKVCKDACTEFHLFKTI